MRQQAERVESDRRPLFRQVQLGLGLDDERDRQLLAWAARLHEVGLDIAHTKYHRHGAYLLETRRHAGLPAQEQRVLAVLVGGHRRKLELDVLERLPPSLAASGAPAHRDPARWRYCCTGPARRSLLPGIELRVLVDGLALRVPEPWLAANPLTLADLRQEIEHLAAGGDQPVAGSC
jgi:exopolyphosphatase / guanosine-5'-triphosphate,3'-diphosphate pyrophosphatase